MRGLSTEARTLLKRADAGGELESSGRVVGELEWRLLVISREVHTDRGSHAKVIESWDRWAKRMQVRPLDDLGSARGELENAASALGAAASLPWQKRTRP
jgi:hypothetical protein